MPPLHPYVNANGTIIIINKKVTVFAYKSDLVFEVMNAICETWIGEKRANFTEQAYDLPFTDEKIRLECKENRTLAATVSKH